MPRYYHWNAAVTLFEMAEQNMYFRGDYWMTRHWEELVWAAIAGEI
jgi:hypothetical protein